MKKNKELTKGEIKKIKKKMKENEKNIHDIFIKSEQTMFNVTSLKIETGRQLNIRKEYVQKLKKEWLPHLKKKFPYIGKRKAQRYMRVANNVDLKKFPSLSYLTMTLLEEIILRYKDLSIDKVFMKYGIDLKIQNELKTGKDISDFKKIIADMITDSRQKTGWLDVDGGDGNDYDSDEKKYDDSNFKKQIKTQRKAELREKRYLSSKGKIEAHELKYSINFSGKKIIQNIQYLLYKQDAIYYKNKKISKLPTTFPVLIKLYELLGEYINSQKKKKHVNK